VRRNRFWKGSLVNRNFNSEHGSVATEISQGLVYVAVLAIVGLWVIAHLEGVSFGVLLDQLRNGTQSH
jgi:TRAP-type C4-dicarboxylate transport system permease small subunit